MSKSHDFDGITEYDNHLPNWWLLTLYGAIAFSFVYWEYFHVFNVGDLPRQELARWQEEKRARESPGAPGAGPAVTAEMLASADKVLGQQLFVANCAACHGAAGEGKIGPNLTDPAWLHGATPLEIHASISVGWPLKGMPGWKPVLGDDKVKAVTAYVLSIKGKNLPGKAPEGTTEGPPAGSPAPTGDKGAQAPAEPAEGKLAAAPGN